MIDISKDIANFFEDKGLSQKDVAQALDTSPQYINAIFSGRKHLGKAQAEKFENRFGLSASWLLTGKGDMLAPKMTCGDGSVQVNGDAKNINAGQTIDKLVDLLNKSQEQISKRDQQIDKLLAMIDRLTSASPVTD